ncbi:type-F conjugative transfer system pilin assembly protein TrbC [Ruegeria sp. HKCCD8929]|uniref:type-F conjugative transfer system pilin assembly protein TrbC n=1 Tax=Ruegeria sp. HKCCD8929 TaxID=2683006 RepID=UPI001488FE2C|nr:type-F conjugative transfer system pilin assembly protein TrbC [Ruegeria sp. HKCCD8929]
MLRIVNPVPSLLLAFCLSTAAAAQEAGEDVPEQGVVEYAPGSTGPIDAPLATIVDEAKRRGEALREELRPQLPAEGAFEGTNFDALREQALNNPRVRRLLNIDDGAGQGAGPDGPRYDGAKIYLLASFSMPKPSLRQLMAEANTYGLPIVFRGFLNNSVYDTQAALEETFGTLDDAVGFSIDPTLFTRFAVEAVPQVIAVNQVLDVCETPGCESDPIPPHDVVKGNVPVAFALDLIAAKGEVAADEAARLLRKGE